jgi:hypothetical membrane protein
MVRRPSIVRLVIAGVIAPVWFITLVIIQGLLQPDYSHIAMPVSALAALPLGWVQNVNFFVTGALMAAFAIGLHHAIRPTRLGFVSVALLLLNTVGFWTAAVFPWINVNGIPTETPGHVVGAVLTFVSAATGYAVISRRMTSDPQWRDLSAYVLGTGILMLLLFILLGAFAIAEGAPLHPWAGLLQRVVVVIWFSCTVVIARRALRLASRAASAAVHG